MPSTKQTLDRLCRLWQRRLGLRDWKIEVNLVEPDDEELEGNNWGSVEWLKDSQEATVFLSLAIPLTQREEILVHELLHVRLNGHAQPTKYDVNEERAINAISEALCTGFRRRSRKHGKTEH